MKKTLLSLVTGVLLAGSASAQFMDGLVKVAGATTDGEGPVTITIFPSQICTPAGKASVTTASQVNIHSSVTRAAAAGGLEWDDTYTIDWDEGGIHSFTPNSDGSMSFNLTPRTYYSVPAGTPISGIAFVLNGNTATVTDWGIEGKAYSAQGSSDCGNFIIPFPVPSALLSAKGRVRTSSLSRQNSPNPFRGVTKIGVSLPTTQHVTVKVYDMLGQEVATLANGRMNAGTTTLKWNASNQKPGFYFYTVSAGNATDTKKMLVLE